MSVAQAQRDIGPKEFIYWKAFDRYVEPLGREYEQTSLLAATTLNATGRLKRLVDRDEFIPIQDTPQTAMEMFKSLIRLPGRGRKQRQQQKARSHNG